MKLDKCIIDTIKNLNTEYLKELYQLANKSFFESYINDNADSTNYYEQLIFVIGEELRSRDVWSY